MSEEKSLEQKILDELNKTGYPTEIVSASIMQRRAWGVIHNPSYFDDSEGRSREFDIRAFRQKPVKSWGESSAVGVYLITECKKSEKPWVFFTTPERHNQSRLGEAIKCGNPEIQIFTIATSSKSLISDEELRKFHHYFQQPRLARTFYEPLKGQEKSQHSTMIYSAVMSSIKATLFHKNESPAKNSLMIYYPLIVFSGNLFDAQVDSNKNIDLLPVKYLQLSFNYRTRSVTPNTGWTFDNSHKFILDVVHETYLDKFLEVIEEEHDILTKHLDGAFAHGLN